jgi:hypothetical protein
MTGRPWFDPKQRHGIFLLASVSRPARGPPSLLSHGNWGSFLLGESAAGKWGWPLTPIWSRGKKWIRAITLSPLVPAWQWGQLYFIFIQNRSVTFCCVWTWILVSHTRMERLDLVWERSATNILGREGGGDMEKTAYEVGRPKVKVKLSRKRTWERRYSSTSTHS